MNQITQLITSYGLLYWVISGVLMMIITASRDYRGKLSQPADQLIMIANMVCGFFLLPYFIIRWLWNVIVNRKFI